VFVKVFHPVVGAAAAWNLATRNRQAPAVALVGCAACLSPRPEFCRAVPPGIRTLLRAAWTNSSPVLRRQPLEPSEESGTLPALPWPYHAAKQGTRGKRRQRDMNSVAGQSSTKIATRVSEPSLSSSIPTRTTRRRGRRPRTPAVILSRSNPLTNYVT
jgi:hypothetical protein